MKRLGMIENYICPNYGVLHTESRENIALDMIERLKNRCELSRRLGVTPEHALMLFYESQTCADLHDRSTGLYLYGDLYVADEYMRETNR